MKAKLKYGVASGLMPVTSEPYKRPYLTGQDIYDSAGVVEYAIRSGYVRGQKYDLVGILNGCLDAVKELIKMGYIVDLDSWLQFFLTLTGQVGDDLKLTEENQLHMRIRTLKDMTVSLDDYTFERVGDTGVRIRIDKLSSPSGKAGEWIKTKALVANGSNLAFNTGWGDKVVINWVEGEGEEAQTKTLEITPSEQSEANLRFDWATGLADVAPGTELAITFRLHGQAGGAEQATTKVVKLVAAS